MLSNDGFKKNQEPRRQEPRRQEPKNKDKRKPRIQKKENKKIYLKYFILSYENFKGSGISGAFEI